MRCSCGPRRNRLFRRLAAPEAEPRLDPRPRGHGEGTQSGGPCVWGNPEANEHEVPVKTAAPVVEVFVAEKSLYSTMRLPMLEKLPI